MLPPLALALVVFLPQGTTLPATDSSATDAALAEPLSDPIAANRAEVPFEFNLYGNFLARKEDKGLFDANGNETTDFGRIRQLDLEFRAPVSETADALVLVGVHSDAANIEYEVVLEEAYLRFEAVPLLDAGPELGVGVFRTHFGRNNALRLHELPQITRPRSLVNFFGETGYAQTGLWLAGDVLEADSGRLRLVADVVDSGNPPLTEDSGGQVGGRGLRLEWEASGGPGHHLSAGGSYFHGDVADHVDRRVTLYGLDFLYSCESEENDDPSAFHFGGEWIAGEFERLNAPTDEPAGFHLWSQLHLSPVWSVGARFDVAEELANPALSTETAGVYAGYAPEGRVRFALGVEHSTSDVGFLDGATRVFGEVGFAFGDGPRARPWIRR